MPEKASWLTELGEFGLAYDAVANSPDPDATLLRFCETTHTAAAELAGWDRTQLECADPHGPDWWAQRPHPPDVAAISTDPVSVEDDADRHRYVVVADGAPRGSSVYHRRDERWLFVHTEIDAAYDGRGLGSTLVRGALDDVRAHGGRVVPLCPFVAGWIEHHPEYDELVDHDLLAALTMR